MSALTASRPHPLCLFFADFLLKFCAIFHLERNPPSAKIPAASPDHLLCTDTNDLGEIPGRGVCINKILIQGFSLGNILCRIKEIHMTISEKYPETWKIKEIFTQKYVLKVSTKQDVGLISKIAFRFFHMKCSKLSNKEVNSLQMVGSISKSKRAQKCCCKNVYAKISFFADNKIAHFHFQRNADIIGSSKQLEASVDAGWWWCIRVRKKIAQRRQFPDFKVLAPSLRDNQHCCRGGERERGGGSIVSE